MRYVTLGEVVELHRRLLQATGGAPGLGRRLHAEVRLSARRGDISRAETASRFGGRKRPARGICAATECRHLKAYGINEPVEQKVRTGRGATPQGAQGVGHHARQEGSRNPVLLVLVRDHFSLMSVERGVSAAARPARRRLHALVRRSDVMTSIESKQASTMKYGGDFDDLI